jgi:hypothetical protein
MVRKPTKPRIVKKAPPAKKLQGVMSEKALLRAFRTTQPFLGGVRASAIVLSCANTIAGDLERTIGQLDLDVEYLARRVQSEVRAAGYVLSVVTCSSTTRLIDVVALIQNAPKA